VQLGQSLVKRGEPGPAGSRELSQIGIGYLTMTDDSLNGNLGVLNIVGARLVPRVGNSPSEDRSCRSGRGRCGMNVVVNEQSDEHVGVEKNGH
jgi:hypothetical protein